MYLGISLSSQRGWAGQARANKRTWYTVPSATRGEHIMPRYYCDYCGTYLTHDSAPGRRQHNRGEPICTGIRFAFQDLVRPPAQRCSVPPTASAKCILFVLMDPPRPNSGSMQLNFSVSRCPCLAASLGTEHCDWSAAICAILAAWRSLLTKVPYSSVAAKLAIKRVQRKAYGRRCSVCQVVCK